MGRCPSWVLCHEHRRSTRRCATVLEMKEGPSGSVIRSPIPSHRERLWSKSHGREHRGKRRDDDLGRHGRERRAQANRCGSVEILIGGVETGAGTPSGISSEDVLIPTERHPACRRREARPGFGTERENLAGDGKGKGASGSNREAESTDALERGGLPRSSDEGPVMGLERRGWVIAVDLGQPVRREEPFVQRKAAAFVR